MFCFHSIHCFGFGLIQLAWNHPIWDSTFVQHFVSLAFRPQDFISSWLPRCFKIWLERWIFTWANGRPWWSNYPLSIIHEAMFQNYISHVSQIAVTVRVIGSVWISKRCFGEILMVDGIYGLSRLVPPGSSWWVVSHEAILPLGPVGIILPGISPKNNPSGREKNHDRTSRIFTGEVGFLFIYSDSCRFFFDENSIASRWHGWRTSHGYIAPFWGDLWSSDMLELRSRAAIRIPPCFKQIHILVKHLVT